MLILKGDFLVLSNHEICNVNVVYTFLTAEHPGCRYKDYTLNNLQEQSLTFGLEKADAIFIITTQSN